MIIRGQSLLLLFDIDGTLLREGMTPVGAAMRHELLDWLAAAPDVKLGLLTGNYEAIARRWRADYSEPTR